MMVLEQVTGLVDLECDADEAAALREGLGTMNYIWHERRIRPARDLGDGTHRDRMAWVGVRTDIAQARTREDEEEQRMEGRSGRGGRDTLHCKRKCQVVALERDEGRQAAYPRRADTTTRSHTAALEHDEGPQRTSWVPTSNGKGDEESDVSTRALRGAIRCVYRSRSSQARLELGWPTHPQPLLPPAAPQPLPPQSRCPRTRCPCHPHHRPAQVGGS